MIFNINKNSTLPVLKMELINDGRNDFHKFYELIQNADIYFTMFDAITGVRKIGKKLASTDLVLPLSDCVGEEYYITYQFTAKETEKAGQFIGQFIIEFLDGTGTLIVPIREDLYINILEGIIKK
jgi:hypothetical protein